MSVLSANAAFYDAFTSSDVRKMQDVWAAGDDVSCVHPGHPVIAGSAAVVNSWRALFSTGAEMPALRATRQKVVIRGNVAWVTCQETTGDEPSSLEAINVFERRDGKWLMCHHHASPVFV
jgi:ketosteroid isomerase-like protein